MAKRIENGKEFRTVDVYLDTYMKLNEVARGNRYGVKGLANAILAEWLAKHPLKELSIIDTIETTCRFKDDLSNDSPRKR